MMGEHLIELDPEHDLLEAFACFDEGDKGWVDVKEMRKFLAELGDRMDQTEVGVGRYPSILGGFNAVHMLHIHHRADNRWTGYSQALSQIDKDDSTTPNSQRSFVSTAASQSETTSWPCNPTHSLRSHDSYI